MKTRRVIFVISAVFTLIFITSCKKEIMKNDPPPPCYFNIYSSGGLKVDPETDYDNIVAYMDKEVYSTKDETVKCWIQNNNPGKGFYFYNTPYVEKKTENGWEQLYFDSEKTIYSRYGFCGTENDPDRCYKASLTVRIADVTPKMGKGEYRIVAYTAVNELFAEFRIE